MVTLLRQRERGAARPVLRAWMDRVLPFYSPNESRVAATLGGCPLAVRFSSVAGGYTLATPVFVARIRFFCGLFPFSQPYTLSIIFF